MSASNTSRAAYRHVNFDHWFMRIQDAMHRDPEIDWCIADLAAELKTEKSTYPYGEHRG
jgi:hypothetical protein